MSYDLARAELEQKAVLVKEELRHIDWMITHLNKLYADKEIELVRESRKLDMHSAKRKENVY